MPAGGAGMLADARGLDLTGSAAAAARARESELAGAIRQAAAADPARA
jgi:hypothetical protein